MVEIHNENENDREEVLNEKTEEAVAEAEEAVAEAEETVAETEEALVEAEAEEAAPEAEAEEETAEAAEEAEGEAEADEPKERELNWAKGQGSAEKADAEASKLKEAEDKYQRLFAEFDNFRKRSEKEKIARYDMGAKDVIEKILPILDNFERGFDTVEEQDKEDAFVTGMDLIYKQFMTTLEEMGVKPIEALGKEFDPDFHNAVMHVDDPDAGTNIIVEEFQKGYTYKDHVVRYSMVKVAN